MENSFENLFNESIGRPCTTPVDLKDDKVNHPQHYTIGEIEVINYIKDKLTEEELRGYCKGNILKYISRERHKNGLEDLKKAEWYLKYLVKTLEKG